MAHLTATALRYIDLRSLSAAIPAGRQTGREAARLLNASRLLHASGALLAALSAQSTPSAAPPTEVVDRAASGGRLRPQLLVCGVAASVLWAATDLLAGLLADDYSFIGRSISELSAAGAATRPLVLPLNLIYDALMVAFSVGVWQAAGNRRLVRVTAALVISHAVVSGVFALVPMHVGESFGTTANTINVVVGATTVFLFLFAMGFGAAAFRGWFRYSSIAILAAYLLLTVFGTVRSSGASWGEPGSRVGLQERTMVWGYLLWVVALAIVLLREQAQLDPPRNPSVGTVSHDGAGSWPHERR